MCCYVERFERDSFMILSVSRRTDIPSFYLDWFLNRLREGWLLVRNPFNPSQVSRVPLSPSVIECIVFWTKNPEPLLMKLDQLKPYRFYIQFTVNPYGKDLESRLPELGKRLDVFRELSRKLGSERMVWRYSPVILNHIHSAESHCAAFNTVARALSGFTEECKLSFLEMYAKIRSRMGALGVVERGDAETLALAGRFAELAEKNSIRLSACGQPDRRPPGIPPSSCLDGALLQRITGQTFSFTKDPLQRGV